MIALIVAPEGVRSMAIMRACFVSGLVVDFNEAGVDRERDLDFAAMREGERLATFFDLGLVMGSSEICAALSAAPPQPRPGKPPGRARPRSAPQRLPVLTAMLGLQRNASPFRAR